jgi:hypothetical protein
LQVAVCNTAQRLLALSSDITKRSLEPARA